MEFLFNFQRCAVRVKLVVFSFTAFSKFLTKKTQFHLLRRAAGHYIKKISYFSNRLKHVINGVNVEKAKEFQH